MKIHALSTGAVRVKHSFLYPRQGPRRQLDLFLPGAFSEPLPIHWAAQTPGFLTGCWTIKDNSGLTMIMFESEDAAVRMSEQVRSAVPAAITLENVELREVAAHA